MAQIAKLNATADRAEARYLAARRAHAPSKRLRKRVYKARHKALKAEVVAMKGRLF